MNSLDIQLEFTKAMEDHGLINPDPLIADGKLQRFTPPGDKPGSKAGWYVLHMDFPPSGAFGYYKSDLKVTWTAKMSRELTAEEKNQLKQRMQADRVRKHREEEKNRAWAVEKASEVWGGAQGCPADHPYIIKKRIQPYIARVHESQVVIPVIHDQKIVGLQYIQPTGEKKFLFGTQQQGSYSFIGKTPEKELIICEGYATGASIHEATGQTVVIAFNAGNLEPVARAMRTRFPDIKIIIAADDDRWTTKPIPNPGIHFAGIAAAAVSGEIRRPLFKSGYEGKPTDFNDLAVLEGIEEVRVQISTGKRSPDPDPKPAELVVPDSIIIDPLPDQTPGKKPTSTITNLKEICDRAGITIRYNVIKKEEEILIPNQGSSIDNMSNVMIARVLDLCNRFKMPTANVNNFLTYLADQNPYNPVTTWILSKPWDGVSRLADLYATIKAHGEEDPQTHSLKTTLIRRWMVSAIAGAFRPTGVSAHGVLVLQGDQYLGKTQWFNNLVPKELGVTANGKLLKPDDKDSVKSVITYWLVELGELDSTFRKSDISQLKSFITNDRDTIRSPYAVKESNYVRRTVFFGSVNPKQFLADETGNRRYWTIECEAINHNHGLDMQQIWAEVYELFKDGESWYLTLDEMKLLNAHNRGFELKDPIEERITTHFNWEVKYTPGGIAGSWMTATQALAALGVDRPTKGDLNRASAIIRKLNGGTKKTTRGTDYLWLPPSFMSML